MSGSLSLPSSTTRLIPMHLYLAAFPPPTHVPCLIPPTTTAAACAVAASPGIAKQHVCLVSAQL